MKKAFKISATLASVSLILSGCATTIHDSYDSFSPADMNSKVSEGYLTQQANNLLVLVDSSSSMAEAYEGNAISGAKFAVEKELLSRMNQTIPNIPLQAGIRSFGSGPCTEWKFSHANLPVSDYSEASFAEALGSMTCTSGGSPMHVGIKGVASDLASVSGKTSIVVFSDGFKPDSTPIPAANALKEAAGGNACIYGVWVGKESEQPGRALLQQLSDASGCGFVTSAEEIASSAGMANFVERVLFTPATPTEADSDGDGVPDSRDKCPDTPKGAIVDIYGCWAFHGVLFDFDSDVIKDNYHDLFTNALTVLNMNPDLTVQVEGHTDNIGSAAYNLKLSERRAEAVKARLVEMGIDPARLSIKGFGFSDPIASNDTEEGRAANRRVSYSRTDR